VKIYRNIKGWLVATAFLATVAILFGGWALNAKVRVENPLKQHMKTMKTVTDYQVKTVGAGMRLFLKLKRSPDLQQVLNAVIKEVEFYYKKPVTELVLESHSNPRLEQIRYQLSFNLEEALSSGRFVQLKTAFEKYNSRGTVAKIYLEKRFIYLQLEDGRNYLYQAVARPQPALVTTVFTGVETEGGLAE
jgi:hypothetical protein